MFNLSVPFWTGILSIIAIAGIVSVDVYTNKTIKENGLEQCYMKVDGKQINYVTKFCDNWEVYE